jgi:hypothetical protein
MEALRLRHPYSRELSARNSTDAKPVRPIGKERGQLRTLAKRLVPGTAKLPRLRNLFPSSHLTE